MGSGAEPGSIGGAVADTGKAIEIRLPYVALGSGDAPAGSAAWPPGRIYQRGRQRHPFGRRCRCHRQHLTRFAATSDALNPIYPFDSPARGCWRRSPCPACAG
ncbi:MAG: hypothetical protein IPO15_19365 [Anaerolineae bacterium]|uniref:hypothetical protein n=1 Tax=Candidatus Amarolinea dominans TaxID=3140696 RepID=UPI003136A91B|nr:hypothetical protein [Anaerolineae bacterium]